MRIQHNIMAMNAYRNYNTNTSALSKNLEKLSSGYKINRAGDDAAGLAISEKMRAQITGLEGAQKNAKDGISLVQTAEGALTEVHDMLNRMYSLAEQSANGTYQDDVDREQLQKEVDQLRTEIDRIADSANFNGIKLLDGSMEGTTIAAGTDAINQVASVTADGELPTAATTANVSFTMGATGTTVTINGQNLVADTATIGALAAITVGAGTTGNSISDLFDIHINGSKVDLATVSGDVITNGTKIELVAKNAGALDTTTFGQLDGISGAASTSATNGSNVGAGDPAQKAKYSFEIDLTKLSGGDTFQLGGKTFKISTDGVTTTGNGVDVVIDLSSYALSGSSVTAQAAAANDIIDALDNTFGTDYNFSSVTNSDLTSGTFTLSFEAITAGSSVDLGELRLGVNNANLNAFKNIKHTVGAEEGIGEAGSYASVSYEVDLSKLAAGDKITIGNTTVEIVKDTEPEGPGQITLANAKDAGKLAAAFQSAGYTMGKIEIAADPDTGKTMLTITDDVKGGKASDLLNGQGKLTFVPATAAAAASSTGGLTLQIGEDAETYNKLTVQIKDTHAKAIGIGDIDIGDQDGAAAALSAIESAINYVSDVRGTLGATQNRLDHTINNLSVMQENIQDAESTIRDTDVAEEMMAYTKNNILIQSAQAMLAQANQVPQGVLQLLG